MEINFRKNRVMPENFQNIFSIFARISFCEEPHFIYSEELNLTNFSRKNKRLKKTPD